MSVRGHERTRYVTGLFLAIMARMGRLLPTHVPASRRSGSSRPRHGADHRCSLKGVPSAASPAEQDVGVRPADSPGPASDRGEWGPYVHSQSWSANFGGDHGPGRRRDRVPALGHK